MLELDAWLSWEIQGARLAKEITVNYRPTTGNLQMMAAAFAGALQYAIQELAKNNGNRRGPWLDQLEAKVLREIDRAAPPGLSIDEDAEAVQLAHDMLKALFAAERESLPK